MNDLIELYFLFFRIGFFSFGGGYTIMPFLQKEIVEDRGWATEEEILNYFAIGQCTPGIIAVNTATFVGHKRKGNIGGVVATLGLVTPSLIIITIIAKFLRQFQDYAIVQNAFSAIQVVVVAMIADVTINMIKDTVNDRTGLFLFIISIISIAFFNISPIVLVIIATIFGIYNYKSKFEKGELK